MKEDRKAKIGLYAVGLKHYWGQFEWMKERLEGYTDFIAAKMGRTADVCCYGMVDDEVKARGAGEWFNAQNVDLVFCYCATYCTSACVLPVHQICKAPVVVLNLQPTTRINYEKTSFSNYGSRNGKPLWRT